MSTLRDQQLAPARATGATFTDVQFIVALADGRYLTVPLFEVEHLVRGLKSVELRDLVAS